MTTILRGVHDPVQRSKALWAGVAGVLAAAYVLLGLAFMVGAVQVEAGNLSFQAVQGFLPGGMRTQGALALVLGIGLGSGLLAPLYGRPLMVRLMHGWLIVATGYWLWLVIEFMGAWVLSGSVAILGAIACGAFTVLSGLLVKLPPVPRGSDRSGGRA